MSRTSGLRPWLSALSAEQLHALLRSRPDAARQPVPRDLADLATGLTRPHSIERALQHASLPALQVAEALLGLGGSADRVGLLQMLGVDDDATAGQVDAALDELLALALVWPSGTRVRMSGSWREILPYPLSLGRSGKELYNGLTVAQLTRIGSTCGLGGFTRKEEWVHALTATLGDPALAERRLALSRPDLADAVSAIAWNGPAVGGAQFPSATDRVPADHLGFQLCLQGWVVPTQWGSAEMPREVAMAVRGPGYRAPFTPAPNAPVTAAVDPERLGTAGRYAAGAAVESVRRLLALLDRAPVQTLVTGGIGVRELRRLGKQLSTSEGAVRLWLETAAAAGLVATENTAVLATPIADEWLAADPAEELATLLLAWWGLDLVPGHAVDGAGKPLPAVGIYWPVGESGNQLRVDTLAALAALDPGRGLVDADEVAELLLFRRPAAHGDDDAPARVRATLAEAELLGLVADGALTPLAHDLLTAVRAVDPVAVLAMAAQGVLPTPVPTARFLPDLSVIVTGAAAVELARLLDDVADAESRDTASTWRFSPGSVRRALDGGRSADELLAELTAVSDDPLPQPLEYLVRDVARRHGQLQVFAAASCIRVADAALGAEVAAHRALASLRLRVLADTILASAEPVTKTIAALRRAGYAPVQQDAQGDTVVERVPVQRARDSRAVPGRRPTVTQDLEELARRLVATTHPTDR